MKLSTAIVAVVSMLSSVEACKCFDSLGPDVYSTKACCNKVGIEPINGVCKLNGTINQLTTFKRCCIDYGTDPICLAKAKKEGKTPRTAKEVRALVSSYKE